MLHACAARFDVTENLENFLLFGVNSTRPSRLFLEEHKNQVCLRTQRKQNKHLLAFPKIVANCFITTVQVALRHGCEFCWMLRLWMLRQR